MLYLAIDQHRKQLTVNARQEDGGVILRRQVSTQWERVRAFFVEFSQRAAAQGGWMAIVEVCGFNDWLLNMLAEYGCREIVLVQPRKRSKQKNDRRDANELGEILWMNRHHLLTRQRLQGLRRVDPPTPTDAAARQLTALRWRLGRQRTRTLNRIQHLLLKHNRQQECPTRVASRTGPGRVLSRWPGQSELPCGRDICHRRDLDSDDPARRERSPNIICVAV